jgi:uroporphyrinogen decarboxylase
MYSKERINKTLNHQTPDKVPIDFGGNQTGIHIKAYKRLIEYLGIGDKEIHTYDYIQQLAAPCEELLEQFNIDTRYIRPLGGMVKIDNFELEYEGKYVGIYDQFGCFWGDKAEKDSDEILY